MKHSTTLAAATAAAMLAVPATTDASAKGNYKSFAGLYTTGKVNNTDVSIVGGGAEFGHVLDSGIGGALNLSAGRAKGGNYRCGVFGVGGTVLYEIDMSPLYLIPRVGVGYGIADCGTVDVGDFAVDYGLEVKDSVRIIASYDREDDISGYILGLKFTD